MYRSKKLIEEQLDELVLLQEEEHIGEKIEIFNSLKVEMLCDIRDALIQLNRNLDEENGINWKLEMISDRLKK